MVISKLRFLKTHLHHSYFLFYVSALLLLFLQIKAEALGDKRQQTVDNTNMMMMKKVCSNPVSLRRKASYNHRFLLQSGVKINALHNVHRQQQTTKGSLSRHFTSSLTAFASPPPPPLLMIRQNDKKYQRHHFYHRQLSGRLYSAVSGTNTDSNIKEDNEDNDSNRLFSSVPSFETSIELQNEQIETLNELQDTTTTTTIESTNNQEANNDEYKRLTSEDLQVLEGLTSRPKKDGNWDIHNPLGWTKTFGSRSKSTQEELLNDVKVNLQPDDEGYFPVDNTDIPDNVAVVRTKEQAQIVLDKLYNSDFRTIYHACDTEVMHVDLKNKGPVGNGYVTCLSMYSGPNFYYGIGKPGDTLWIDNLDDAHGVLLEFKEWMEDERYKKIWHNYGFDRHVMFNEGINVQGLGADTMHMARLQDTSRDKIMSFMNAPPSDDYSGSSGSSAATTSATGYSLEALSEHLLSNNPEIGVDNQSDVIKKSYKELFGVPRLRKDGTEGNILDVPPIEVLQRDPRFRKNWIDYSCKDAKSTWYLHKVLREKLQQIKWVTAYKKPTASSPKNEMTQKDVKLTLYDYYRMYMCPFAEVLTDMERRGIYVDKDEFLKSTEEQARMDRKYHSNAFRQWAFEQIGPAGLLLNPASSTQLQTFLFGGNKNSITGEYTETERIFSVARDELSEETLEAYYKALEQEEQQQEQNKQTAAAQEDETEEDEDELDLLTAVQLKVICKDQGLKCSGKKSDLQERIREHFLNPSSSTTESSSSKDDDGIQGKTVAELKELCKQLGLKRSGKKADLQERLHEYYDAHNVPDDDSGDENQNQQQQQDEFDHYSDIELSSALLARNLNGSGTRQELIKRLRDDLEYTNEIMMTRPPTNQKAYISISEALETIAQLSSAADDSENENGAATETASDTDATTKTTTTAAQQNLKEILEYLKIKKEEKKNPKNIDVKIRSLGWLESFKYTQGGAPSVTADVLKKLAGEDPLADPPKYGTAYEACGGGQKGHDACVALYSLCSIGSIDTMIGNFLTSLQSLADEENSRVHCSMNLNTETGRLSSRRPNLQNQPSLEKDKYQIRKAFQSSSPKNNFIVADYSQLELRILASMTDCKSMIDAFKAGGDFHSRTAVDMFDYIREKIENGECLLEKSDSAEGKDLPLVKDIYASERKKAKTLNFSIAYGKTAHGLSADWGVSQEEAQNMLTKFFEARPEIKEWQDKTKQIARKYGYTRTLMGRYRHLPHAMTSNKLRNRKLIGHAERASINTPIQGGAADIVMMAMIKINQSPKLQRLGWILILQIHDEVILEGPQETAEEAFEEVIKCMESPWVFGLDKTEVPMIVDGTYSHNNWYDAK